MTRVEIDRGAAASPGGTGSSGPRTAGRGGSVNPKVLVGILVALAGVGSLAWSVKSMQRPERRPRIVADRPADARGEGPASINVPLGDGDAKLQGTGATPRIQVGGPGGPGGSGPRMMGIPAFMQPVPVETYDFPRVKEPADLRTVLDTAGDSISSALGNDDSFSWMALSQRDKLVEAVRLAVEPLALGTAEEFAGAVAALKGRNEGEPLPSAQMFERLSPALAMSSFDVSNLRVAGIDTSEASPLPRRGGVSVMQIRTQDDEGPTNRLSIMSFGTDEIFPDVSDFMGSKKRAVEVRMPVRTKGSDEKTGDLDLSLVMVWNEKVLGWQPADYRLFVRNGEVGSRLMPPRTGGAAGADPTGK